MIRKLYKKHSHIFPAVVIIAALALLASAPFLSSAEEAKVAENASHPVGVWLKIVKNEHKLYVMKNASAVAAYPVAIGKNQGQKLKAGDCRTPEGKFFVQQVQDARSWTHDFKDGKGVIQNAYGPWFIRLKTQWSGIGIHGTHDPASIGTNATEGCIRLRNENLRTLKENYIKRGMAVWILP